MSQVAPVPHREPVAIEKRQIDGALNDLNETAEAVVALVRDYEKRFAGSIAAGASFAINAAYLADLLADTLSDGLTEDATRVLTAAVKRGLA